MAVSWPPTSGAARTSVARTTPTLGETSAEPHKRYPPRPAATRTSPSAMIPFPARLTMRAPPLDQRCGHHRKREIDDGESPQTAPVVRHLPEGCAELVDADESIDREIRWKYVTRLQHRRG